MEIERAVIEDAEEILSQQKLAYQSQARLYNDYRLPPLVQTLEEIKLDFEKQIILKAVIGVQLVGSVRAFTDGDTCYVGRLFVHPEHQNKGIGMAMMQEIETVFHEAKRYELFTGHKSEKSKSLYHKLGYRIIKTERITDALSLVTMEKIKE